MVLGGKGKGVHVDANRRHVGEVLVRLDQVEVITSTLLEPVMAVELDEGRHDGVLASLTLNETMGISTIHYSEVPIIRVVERLLAIVLIDGGGRASGEVIALNNPREELDGVVEAHPDLVGNRRDGLLTRELELLNEVLVGVLSHLPALIRVEVDVVDEQRASLETLGANIRVGRLAVSPAHILNGGKVDVDLDFVVLEGNQGESKARVAAVEELEGDVQGVSRGTLAGGRGGGNAGNRYARRNTVRVAILTSGRQGVHKFGNVADHTGVTTLLSGGERKLVPDVHPVAILLINLLASNLQLHLLDEVVAGPVEPTERSTRQLSRRDGILERNLGERRLNIRLPDKVTVAGNLAGNVLAVEGGRTIESLFNGLNGKVGVATVDYLEEGNLRIAGKIHILSAIGNELHKSSSHFECLYHNQKK